MMKKSYEMPKAQVALLDTLDVLTLSGREETYAGENASYKQKLAEIQKKL